MHHAERSGGPVAAAQNWATHGPLDTGEQSGSTQYPSGKVQEVHQVENACDPRLTRVEVGTGIAEQAVFERIQKAGEPAVVKAETRLQRVGRHACESREHGRQHHERAGKARYGGGRGLGREQAVPEPARPWRQGGNPRSPPAAPGPASRRGRAKARPASIAGRRPRRCRAETSEEASSATASRASP